MMPTLRYERMWRAVRNREPLSFSYDNKLREAQPIILGYSADGQEALIAYQTGGQTSPHRTLPGWRCFYLEDVRDIKLRKGDWREGDSHKQDQSCVQYVDVNIPDTL